MTILFNSGKLVDELKWVKGTSRSTSLMFKEKLPYVEPVVTECKKHTIHTQTQVVASRKPKEIKRTHEGEANFTT